MFSEARQTANAANAHLSTGPTTAEGKARSSQNARKHGLTASQLVIAAEDREEFEEFLLDLQAEIRPDGALQQILFDELAASAWNLRRIRHMEAEISAQAASYADIPPPQHPHRAQLPSLPPRAQSLANRRRPHAHAPRSNNGESPSSRLKNADCKTNPSASARRPQKRRRRLLVRSRRGGGRSKIRLREPRAAKNTGRRGPIETSLKVRLSIGSVGQVANLRADCQSAHAQV